MSSEKAQTEWCNLLDLASQGDTDIVIERHGQATAVVIGYGTYRAIQKTLAEIRASASAQERGQQMAAILQELAELPEPIAIKDAVAWQIEQRQERRLGDRPHER